MTAQILPIFAVAQPFLAETGDDNFSWPLAIFLVGFFAAVASVLVVVVWQLFSTYRARMSVARESAYRQLADDSVRAQERVADRLDRAVSELTDLRQRTAELERMLKEVG
ncbi:MAG: hypothetical protein AB7N24_16130 [Dehalococcoidia bacterium]